jgi:transcriptional regulator with XRE-family HTH domain
MEASQALKLALERNEWTQQQAATAAGIHPQNVSRIISAGRKPQARTIGKLRKHIPGFSELLDAVA